MTTAGARTRTLVVGPVGQRPWIPLEALVESLAAIGHDVVVNGQPDDVVPSLRPVPPRLGAFVNSAPGFVAWLVRMLFVWRRRARRSLSRSGVDRVLVWDEVLALLCRMARPKGVEVVWVVGPPEGARFHQRLLRAAVARTADRVVTSWHGEKRFARGNEVVVRPPVPSPSPATARVGGWVVFGSDHDVTPASLARLRARADVEPARAIVFSARNHDRVMPWHVEALCAAANPEAVWWAGEDEWVRRLGGIPAVAIDPSDDLQVDHRHLLMLSAGAPVLVSPENTRGLWQQLVSARLDPSGWKCLAFVDDVTTFANDAEWAAHAFGGAS